jgi:uncharacterized protein (TIGR01777 family)
MKVAITGASGLIGSALVRDLRADGHEVLKLVRREPAGPDEVRWSPGGSVDTERLEGCDAVVHLAGAGIASRLWTESYKRKIRDSRVDGTTTLAEAIAGMDAKPRVLVSGSAIGYYGDGGDRELDEESPSGDDFLSGVVREWEAAAVPAAQAGVRVVHPRTGVVLAKEGGMLGTTLPLFKLGLGGKLGDGRQWISWIAMADYLAALRLLIDSDLEGPVNMTAPFPVRNAGYTRTLGRVLGRPTVFTVPRFVLKAALRELADEAPLVSQRVLPRRLEKAGFTFGLPELEPALRAVLR